MPTNLGSANEVLPPGNFCDDCSIYQKWGRRVTRFEDCPLYPDYLHKTCFWSVFSTWRYHGGLVAYIQITFHVDSHFRVQLLHLFIFRSRDKYLYQYFEKWNSVLFCRVYIRDSKRTYQYLGSPQCKKLIEFKLPSSMWNPNDVNGLPM